MGKFLCAVRIVDRIYICVLDEKQIKELREKNMDSDVGVALVATENYQYVVTSDHETLEQVAVLYVKGLSTEEVLKISVLTSKV